jgi:hypothetical protein
MLKSLSKIAVITMLSLVIALCIGSVSAQTGGTTQQSITLTETHINDTFQLRSESNRRGVAVGDINLDGVDILSTGEVQVSFHASVTRPNGTTETYNIIAILIGQVRNQRYSYTLQDVLVSSVGDGTSNTMLMEEEGIFYFVTADFNRYIRGQARAAGMRIIVNGQGGNDQLELIGTSST